MNVKREQCLAGQRCQVTSEAEAWHCLLQHSEPRLQQIVGLLAERYDLHVSSNQLYEWSNPFRAQEAGRYVHQHARIVLPVTAITRNYVLLDWWERELGRVAFRVPAGAGGQQETFEAGSKAVREFAEALDTWSHTIADGRVNPNELADVQRQAYDAIAAIHTLVQLAERRLERSPELAPFRRAR